MHKQEDKMINFKVDAEKIKLFSVNSWNILYTKLYVIRSCMLSDYDHTE